MAQLVNSYFSFQKIFLNPYLSTVDFSHKFFIQDAVNQCCSVAGFPLRHGRSTALSSNKPGFVSLFFSPFSVKGRELIWGYSSRYKFLLISSLISGWCSVEKQMKKYLGRDKDSASELWKLLLLRKQKTVSSVLLGTYLKNWWERRAGSQSREDGAGEIFCGVKWKNISTFSFFAWHRTVGFSRACFRGLCYARTLPG